MWHLKYIYIYYILYTLLYIIIGASGRNSRTNIPTLLNMIESVVLASYAPGKGSLALHDPRLLPHS